MSEPLSSNPPTIEQRCSWCGSTLPFKSVTTNAGMVYACEVCSNHWFRAYGDDERPEAPTSKPQFCRHCGAGVGEHRRPGEGTCEKCDPEGVAANRAKNGVAALVAELAQWTTWGTIEIAIRNPNVSSYMDHWEKRATEAEAERDRLLEDLRYVCGELRKITGDKEGSPIHAYARSAVKAHARLRAALEAALHHEETHMWGHKPAWVQQAREALARGEK